MLSKFEQSKEERDNGLEAVKADAAEAIATLKEDDAVRQAVSSSFEIAEQQLQGADQEADASADLEGWQARRWAWIG